MSLSLSHHWSPKEGEYDQTPTLQHDAIENDFNTYPCEEREVTTVLMVLAKTGHRTAKARSRHQVSPGSAGVQMTTSLWLRRLRRLHRIEYIYLWPLRAHCRSKWTSTRLFHHLWSEVSVAARLGQRSFHPGRVSLGNKLIEKKKTQSRKGSDLTSPE